MLKRTLKLTKEDKDWAYQVKKRDGFSCVICGSLIRPNAHHLIARENKETKLDVDNGLTLCPRHHFFCRQVSAHNNPLGLWIWLERYRPYQLDYCRKAMFNILLNHENDLL
jgi:hypothetical protein